MRIKFAQPSLSGLMQAISLSPIHLLSRYKRKMEILHPDIHCNAEVDLTIWTSVSFIFLCQFEWVFKVNYYLNIFFFNYKAKR